ncbi:hypothetical protein V8E51_008853 [Hyaloscypha variabilis]
MAPIFHSADNHSRADSSSTDYDVESKRDFEHMLALIADYYPERENDDMQQTSVYERYDQFKEWRDWYIEKYPHTPPKSLVQKDGKDVDIRVLFMAYPTLTYSILLVLEACFEVDKAICGLDTVAFSTVKQWHMPEDMTAYNYLLSDELVLWWKRELCELNNEIDSGTSNGVSVYLRFRGICNAFAKLDHVIDCGRGPGDTIGTRIWTYASESAYDDLPSGLWESIWDRKVLLEDSIKIMSKGLKQNKPREGHGQPVLRAVSGSTESEGLKQRIPKRSSSEATESFVQFAASSSISHRNVPENPNPAVLFDHQFRETATTSSISRYLTLLIERTTDWLHLAKKLLGGHKFVEFLVHAETCLVVFSTFVAASAIFIAISITRGSVPVPTVCQISLGSDSNFFATVSQALLSVLSLYLVILPIARSRSLGLRYRFGFWGSLFISFLASALSVGLYSSYPVAAEY